MIEIEAGDWLVSPPSMQDTRFVKVVVMITHHSETSLGFCINKNLKHRFCEVVGNSIAINLVPEPEVFWGGPVNPTTVWMIHDNTWNHPSSININKDWNILSHVTMFDGLNDEHKPKDFRIILGCASWAPYQLESELRGEPPWTKDHSWLVLKQPDPSLLTSVDPDDLWKVATDLCLRQSVSQLMS
jgi:putative transcriptional regulator